MTLTDKQTKFASFIVENIMKGIIPVIKTYIDNKVEKTKKEIISEVKSNDKINIEKLDETKKTLKEHSFNLAKDLFGDMDVEIDGNPYDNLRNVSPSITENVTETNSFANSNLDTLQIDYNKEVSMDSVLKQAEKVNESVVTGEYKHPSLNMIKSLENSDFSKFLD